MVGTAPIPDLPSHAATRRFVILLHTPGEGDTATPVHWDLLIEKESGGLLIAWRLEHDPTVVHDTPIRATPIASHRRLYLDYEGPISGNRGSVQRVEAGWVWADESIEQAASGLMHGRRLMGWFSIAAGQDDQLVFRWHAPPLRHA